jgi:hypothetical protein
MYIAKIAIRRPYSYHSAPVFKTEVHGPGRHDEPFLLALSRYSVKYLKIILRELAGDGDSTSKVRRDSGGSD